MHSQSQECELLKNCTDLSNNVTGIRCSKRKHISIQSAYLSECVFDLKKKRQTENNNKKSLWNLKKKLKNQPHNETDSKPKNFMELKKTPNPNKQKIDNNKKLQKFQGIFFKKSYLAFT